MRCRHRFSVFALLLAGAASAQADSNLRWSVQYGAPPLQYGTPPVQYSAPPVQYGAPPVQYGAPPAYVYPHGAVVVVPQQSGPAYPEPRFRSPYNDVDRPWVRQQQEREYQWRLQQEQMLRNQQSGGQNGWGRR